MSEILEILDENRLTSADRVKERLFRSRFSDVRNLREGIRHTLRAEADRARGRQSGASIEAASFLANSSLRGDSGCSMWECHSRKVQVLARYAALYCDSVVVPVQLDSHEAEPDEAEQRYTLARGLLTGVELRRLVEAGIAVLIPDELQLCEEHLREAVPLRPMIQGVARRLSRQASKQISVTYRPSKGRGPAFFDFEGSTDFIEHGHISYLVDSMPPWLKRAIARARNKGSLKLAAETISKYDVPGPIFETIANDVALQEYWGIA